MWNSATPSRPAGQANHEHSAIYNTDGHQQRQLYPLFWSSTENSPESVLTTDTSPQRSPRTNFRHGPQLLPKIRCQDQTVEPIEMAGPLAHGRAVSMGVPQIHTTFPAAAAASSSFYRRATGSPDAYERCDSPHSAMSLPGSIFSHTRSASSAMTSMTTPLSTQVSSLSACTPSNYHATLPRFSPTRSPLHQVAGSPDSTYAQANISSSRKQSVSHSRNQTSEMTPGHRPRTASQSSAVDEATLLKHGYPTQYRKIPQYITSASQAPPVQPIQIPTIPSQPPEFNNFTFSDENSHSASQTPVEGPLAPPVETTTLMRYLTEPCPRPTLISRSVSDAQRHWDYGWWDVRNLRNWSSFNMQSLMAVPGFNNLLHIPLDSAYLPHPQAVSAQPDTEYILRDVYSNYFATRVNAALETTQGPHHLFLRPANSATTHHYPKPDFISTHDNDMLRTLRGDERGHLVGIVKAYEEWNTGMRTDSAPSQVRYLKGLAQLHRVMREHGCRYGFIITEIELLCVRAGAEDAPYFAKHHGAMTAAPAATGATSASIDEGPRPIFGLLETATPISLSIAGPEPATGRARLTPALALWYLHMLAKDEPLPNHPPWKMEVGGPAALSRHNHRPRDEWMPKIVVSETRSAKRLRGWVYPNEPFNRREAPNVRRRRA